MKPPELRPLAFPSALPLPVPSTRDIRRRIKSVKNTRQITKAMELVAASKMKKAQQAAPRRPPYAQLMADMLAALATRVEESFHPFLVQREVKTRGIILVTTDKGLCGPLNANLFKLVTEIKDAGEVRRHRPQGRAVPRPHPARPARRFPVQRPRAVRRGQGRRRVHGEAVSSRASIDTIEVIYPRFKNTLIQEPSSARCCRCSQ
jgi:F-type H+-transporting ATPase subunit gamma